MNSCTMMTRIGIPGLLAIWGMGAEAQTQDADKARAPQVKEIVPAVGATNVDPSVEEIRVTFDMPMSREGYSFTGSGPNFPNPTGPAKWADAYTCVLAVKLKANWEYRFGINSERYKNFRSIWLVPADPTVCNFKTAGVSSVNRKPDAQRRLNIQAFDTLADAIRNRYSYRDLRGVDWEAHFAEHRAKVVGTPGTKEWVRRAATMLAKAEDVHMALMLDGETYPTFVRKVRSNFAPEGLRRMLPSIEQRSANIATAMTGDGIGYISIATWSGGSGAEIAKVHDYLAEMSDAKGMIVDVRANAGGSETLAKQVAGWFVDAPAVYAKHVYRRGPKPDDFTPVRERTIKPNRSSRRFPGPTAVLMGRQNMSSCEAFLLMMKQAKNATLIGETSYGSSGNPERIYLPNGVQALVPGWKAMRPGGSCFEGEGIKPDITVSSDGVNFKQADPVLTAALTHLRKLKPEEDKR